MKDTMTKEQVVGLIKRELVEWKRMRKEVQTDYARGLVNGKIAVLEELLDKIY